MDVQVSNPAREAREVEGSTPFRWLVRAGFLARGLTYAVIGGLSVALAAGAGSPGTPNQQGALQVIAQAPLGRVVVAVAALGLLAYALWKLTLMVIGKGPDGGGGASLFDRVANFGGGMVYLGFFFVSVRVLFQGGGNPAQQQRSAAAGVLGWPGGRFLVAVAGLVLIGVSIYQCVDAVRGQFARENKTSEMSDEERRVFIVAGRIGLLARAIVFILVGYFLLRTAIDSKPSAGLGLDGALAQVGRQPGGPWLLGVVAAGLLVFAAFSFMEARRRRL